MATRLNVSRSPRDAVVIEAAGEPDLASSPRLREVLLPAIEQGTAVLNASNISFCDSCGLRTLAEARHAARAHGATFRLAAPSEAVIRVLELVDALDIFDIFPAVETALKD
jgi:anti-sigma B factor antagonist